MSVTGGRRGLRCEGADVSRLNTFDTEELLEMLHGPDAAMLVKTLGGSRYPRYPHFDVLQSFLFSKAPESRSEWATCLRRLIELRAPIDNHDQSAGAVFCQHDWCADGALEQIAEMAQLYLDAGYIQVDTPLPGVPLVAKFAAAGTSGKLPLAAAIAMNNAEAVRLLCGAGASMDVGPVYGGGPRRGAIDFAQECGAARAMAVLVECAMERHLASHAAAAAAAAAETDALNALVPAQSTSRARRVGL